MHDIKWEGRILAVHATAKGLGYVIFEGPQSPIDWGVKSVRTKEKNDQCLVLVEELLGRFCPDVIVLEDAAAKGSRRSERIKRLYRAVLALAAARAVETHAYSRTRIRRCFDEAFGASRKHEIAQTLAVLLPELAHRVPPIRKLWQSEDVRMGIFDAAALVYAFFRYDAHPDGTGPEGTG